MFLRARHLIAGVCLGLMVNASALAVYAQQQRGGGEETGEDKAKQDEEWGERNLRLRAVKAEGPCPYVKVLYDAARYHEFKDNREATSAAMWTGEINGVSSDCAYKGEDPIEVAMTIGFSLGRGPMADGETKVYRYWVAVTEKDTTVLAKQYFELPVTFRPGEQKVDISVPIEDIVIPRADVTVSGSNFEVLVGFDVTPQMVAFNRDGKHFRYTTAADQK
ncbi:hypothetical protein ABI_31700 [Asticcacaulis biprosthecium C19]|uniref:Tat pathway signal sequence domain protein n=1 Tax=Asticcacaulis biprosthecium C19 TaxID=715226 RepID=F4QRM9_9CAUL|nr:hypothetical protein [Asticcacaulis biprosthecium]EGF90155.1 hypothetical protein ABI_31700 [Asticcacaulis biprosthecium C19]